MSKRLGFIVIFAVIAGMALATAGTTSASTGGTTVPGVQTELYADGSYATLIGDVGSPIIAAVPVKTAAASTAPCGNYTHRVTVKLWNVFGWVMWTYRMTFSVHVCNGAVRSLVALYDEPMDSAIGWSWCGNIVRTWTNNQTSATGYTKGCFQVLDQGWVSARYPWGKITTGWNGNLWFDSWGVS